jgi:hypothetical protein
MGVAEMTPSESESFDRFMRHLQDARGRALKAAFRQYGDDIGRADRRAERIARYAAITAAIFAAVAVIAALAAMLEIGK